MPFVPRPVETHVNWRGHDMRDPATWTVDLTPSDHAELDVALKRASAKPLTEVTREDFPLEGLADKLAKIEDELLDGRGFVLLRKLDARRYSKNDLTRLYWGIGSHLGTPWPQNKYGATISDIVDRGDNEENFDQRDDRRGGIALEYHTDAADIVGLLCLGVAQSGGTSSLANVVAIYNELVTTRPDLVSVLHEEFPFDFRGEQPTGAKPFFLSPIFTVHKGRLFVRYVREYIRTSQRHAEAPRLSPRAIEAMDALSAMAANHCYNVHMDFEPGDVQFINNYPILHARAAYVDAPELGLKRHFQRLWLTSRALEDRPKIFERVTVRHWMRSRLARDAPARTP